MTKITLEEAAELLRSRENVLLITHTRPDGDTLGSAAALCSALRRLGKRSALYPNAGVTAKYLPFVQPYLSADPFTADYTVSVDTADVKLFPEGFGGQVDLAIDHHPSNTGFAALTLVDPESAACGEIILELIKLLTGCVTKEEADLLYIAVSTDTGCFQYSNVTAHTHLTAAELLRSGADSARLSRLFFRTFSAARLRLEGYIYSQLISLRGGEINIALVTREMMEKAGVVEDDMDDIASLPGRVMGSRASVTIREKSDGSSKVSLRTVGGLNASKICSLFGGGGHAAAAGAELDCPPDEAAEKLRRAIEAEIDGEGK